MSEPAAKSYHQALRFGAIVLEQDASAPSPYMVSGRKMYVLGTTDAAFHPIGTEHLVGEIGVSAEGIDGNGLPRRSSYSQHATKADELVDVWRGGPERSDGGCDRAGSGPGS